MLLTITTTAEPASDLGYLLHKHPGRVQSFELSAGIAHVFYPEVGDRRTTAALLLEVDPIDLVRGRKGPSGEGFALGQYVNDRPYAASSMLSVAIKQVYRTALTGRCTSRQQLADSAIPLRLEIPALPCRGGGDELVQRLFAPLGWQVETRTIPLDPAIPAWGDSTYVDLILTGDVRLADALNHLYVLLPVTDDAKHYWVSTDEVDKLVRAGGGWLATHPERELITRRYLAHRRELAGDALARLNEIDDVAGPDDDADLVPEPPDRADGPRPLAQLRRDAVLAAVRETGARRVGDFGCGEGVLVRELLGDRTIDLVVAADVSTRALQRAARNVQLDRMTDQQRGRLQLIQSSLTYRDDRLAGLDAVVLMEVIEHVDPPRLAALEHAVFGHAAPGALVVTTPNAEYNVRFPSLDAGSHRHHDHRFEWTRRQFSDWVEGVGSRFGYTTSVLPVGVADPEVGPPTQLAVFIREAS